MDRRLNELQEWGCSVDTAVGRLLGDEDLYIEFLMEFTNEPGFDMLAVAIDEGRQNDAFEYAHMLKGVIANLGLDPLQQEVIEITEDLREKADMEAVKTKYEKVAASFEKFRKIMGEDS